MNRRHVRAFSNDEAFNDNLHIELTWAYTGTGIDGFIVERSTNGNSFEEVGTTSSSELAYTDEQVSLDNSYQYRIKAFQGEKQSCSSPNTPMLTVVTGLISENPWGLVFTNPVIGPKFQIKGLKGRTFSVALYALNGKKLYSNEYYRQDTLISTANLDTGLHLLQIGYQGETRMYKVVIRP